MAIETSGFHVNDPKYRCCCGNLHVVTGTKIFLFLFILGMIPNILVGIALRSFLLGGPIPFVVIVITLFGLSEEDPEKMWSFIFISAVTFILVAIAHFMVIILSLFSAATIIRGLAKINKEFDNGNKYGSGASFVFVIVMIELMLLAVLAFSFWQLRVAFSCKQYFEHKRWARVNARQQNQHATHSTALLQQRQPIIVSNVSPSAPRTYSAVMTEDETATPTYSAVVVEDETAPPTYLAVMTEDETATPTYSAVMAEDEAAPPTYSAVTGRR